MSRDEIVDKLDLWLQQARTNAEISHPAFSAFVTSMEDRRYGTEETVAAWGFFREGWDAHVMRANKIAFSNSYGKGEIE